MSRPAAPKAHSPAVRSTEGSSINLPHTVECIVDGRALRVATGTSVAAALAQLAPGCARLSVSGEPRAPLCGMGICHECRVTIDGRIRLACQTLCSDGLRVETGTRKGAGK